MKPLDWKGLLNVPTVKNKWEERFKFIKNTIASVWAVLALSSGGFSIHNSLHNTPGDGVEPANTMFSALAQKEMQDLYIRNPEWVKWWLSGPWEFQDTLIKNKAEKNYRESQSVWEDFLTLLWNGELFLLWCLMLGVLLMKYNLTLESGREFKVKLGDHDMTIKITSVEWDKIWLTIIDHTAWITKVWFNSRAEILKKLRTA
jgi:hypothetical protein